MPEGMEYPRDVFERGIVACGLHVGGAKALWDAYTEFERAVLNSLQEMQQNNPEEAAVVQQVWVAFRLKGGYVMYCSDWINNFERGCYDTDYVL